MQSTVEKMKGKAVDLVFPVSIIIVLLIGAGMFIDMWKTGHQQIAQQELSMRVSKTEAGEFAVENFTSCKQAGGAFSSPASDAQCITETINGAEKLRGREFSAKVTNELADWLAQSKKLHSK